MLYSYIDLGKVKSFNSRTDFVKSFLEGKKMKVLDVGNLGDGVVNVDIRKIVKRNGGEYYGLDINYNLAKKLNLERQFIGDIHKTDIPSDSFDCIYAGQIIEHSWRPAEMIKECRRILKEGGYLLLDTPNIFDVVNILRVMLKKRDTIGDNRYLSYHEAKDNLEYLRKVKKESLTQPQHKIIFSPAMLRQIMNMHGFKVIEISYINKSTNVLHYNFLKFFPQLSQKIGVIAQKLSLEDVFNDIINKA